MKDIYFIRHGQTEWNAIARMQGQWNSDLSELGQQQADTNGQFLQSLGIDALYVSPLSRTRQTAAIINQYLNLAPTFDDRIMEWDCGDWSGYLYKEIREKWPTEWDAWETDRFHYRGPNCENYPDMIERSKPFLDEILARSYERIAVVSHGMIGRVMVAQLMGFSEADYFTFHQGNDTVYRVTVNDQTRELSHFVGGDGPHPGVA